MKQRKQVLRDEDGSVAVEFALLIWPYIIMIFMIIEFGRLAFTMAALNYAAQQTTRYAIVREGSDEAEIEALEAYAAEAIPFMNLNTANFKASKATEEGTDDTSTCRVSVTVSYDYDPWIPINTKPITLSASSEGFLSFSTGDDATCT